LSAPPEIVRLRGDQVAEAAAVLARAFQDDPAWLWVLPDAERRAKALPLLFELGFRLIDAQIWTTQGKMLGAARWMPPGRPRINVWPALRAVVATPLSLRGATSRFLAYGRAVDGLRQAGVSLPHWYLAGIGVEPAQQRQGIGGALLAPGIDAAERDGVPCALITNSEENLSFYRAHGFEVLREGETPGGGPHAWLMARNPVRRVDRWPRNPFDEAWKT
jgi:ribosomal protein S18 acetylase RimI-like enzyme